MATDTTTSGTGSTPETPTQVDGEAELDQFVDAHGVVLVDFYADWCGPCRALEPIVERVAAGTDAAVAKVDVDANQQLAADYGVRGVPTMVLFADGEQVEQIVGLRNERELRELVDEYAG